MAKIQQFMAIESRPGIRLTIPALLLIACSFFLATMACSIPSLHPSINITRGTESASATAPITPGLASTAIPDQRATALTASPEGGLLTGQPCAPPCWYGITPGVTKHDELIRLLQQNPYVFPGTVKEYPALAFPLPSGTAVIGWDYPASTYPPHTTMAVSPWDDPFNVNRGGGVFLKDNVVEVLTLDAQLPISLRDLVKQFGEPSKVQAGQRQYGYSPTPESFYPRLEGIACDGRIYYPQLGLMFRFATVRCVGKSNAEFRSDLVVDNIYLFPPGSADDLVSDAKQFQGPTTLEDVYARPLQDWRGLGDYPILPRLPLNK